MNFDIIRELKTVMFSILKTPLENICNFQEQMGNINGGSETSRKESKTIFFFFPTTLHGLGDLRS